MRLKVVSSFNEHLWNRYAKKCVTSWVEHLDLAEGSEIEVWINGPFPRDLPLKTNSGTPFRYKSLDTQSDGWTYFYEHWSQHPKPEVDSNNSFRFNFLPFSCKVYALAEASWATKNSTDFSFDAFLWLDADVLCQQKVTSEILKEFLGNKHLAWLDRAQWGYCESGFLLASTQGDTLNIFLEQANLWGSGMLFQMREWHDRLHP